MGFPTGYETDRWPLVKARWYKDIHNQKREVRLIVIHTMEAPEKGKTAENVAHYFEDPRDKHGKPKKVSAHLCIDNNSIIQCVYDNDVAWAAPGANHNGIQLELAGYAGQSRRDWLDGYSLDMLEKAADAAAQYCLKYAIPPRHLTDDELEKGEEGIIGHVQATKVFKKGTHTDPGEHFPWEDFIKSVKHCVGLRRGDNGGDKVPGVTNHIVRSGDTLSKIARECGTSVSEILALNPEIKDPNLIYVNDVIKVSCELSSSPPPGERPDMDEVDIMARTIYGEARGEPEKGKHAVGWVIMNRLAANTWYGRSVAAVCLKPYQFSCWNKDDPNLPKLLSVTSADPIFAKCIDAAKDVLSANVADPTKGATHFHAYYIDPPAWTRGATMTVRIGSHIFYKDVD